MNRETGISIGEEPVTGLPHGMAVPVILSAEGVDNHDGSLPSHDTVERFLGGFLQNRSLHEHDILRAEMNLSPHDARAMLLSNRIEPYIRTMLRNPDGFRNQLGILFSHVRLSALPPHVTEGFRPHPTRAELTQTQTASGRELCTEAEVRMVNAIDETGVLSIQQYDIPYFLVKFRGKPAALCVQDIVTPDGTVFLRGNWYAPRDSETIDALDAAFKEGKGTIEAASGSWTFMRSLFNYRKNEKKLDLADAVKAAWDCPEEYANTTITAEGYRWERRLYISEYREPWPQSPVTADR